MAGAVSHRFNVEEYYRMAETGVLPPGARVELLDGEVVDMPAISPLHASVVRQLNRLFHLHPHDGWLMSVQDPVRLDAYSEPQPDLMLLKPIADDYRSHHPKPEEVFLLIEVSDSTLDTDLKVKLPLYGRAGIAEVWIVNMDDRRLEVYREPHFDSYASTQILHEGDKVAPAHFPDTIIEVAELLRR